MEVIDADAIDPAGSQSSVTLPSEIDAPPQSWLERQQKRQEEAAQLHDRRLRFPDDMPRSDDSASGAPPAPSEARSLTPAGQPTVKSPPVPSASTPTTETVVKAAPPDPPAPPRRRPPLS